MEPNGTEHGEIRTLDLPNPSTKGGSKRKRLTDGERDAKKLAGELAKEARKEEKQLLELAALDPAVPDVKTVNVNDQLLFICSYTGMTMTTRFSIPVPGRNKKVRYQGAFLNPAAALAWVYENQTKTEKYQFYEDVLWAQVKATGAKNLNKSILTDCPRSKLLQRFGGTMSDDTFRQETSHDIWVAKALQIKGWQTDSEFAAERLAKASEKSTKQKPPKKPRVSYINSEDDVVAYDCRKIESPLVCIPLSPEKFLKHFLTHFDRELQEIPFVRLLETDKPTDLVIFHDPSDETQAKEMREFTKLYNEGVSE